MRSDIAFETEDGTTLRGWHVRPAAPTGGRQPVIVMAHGFSAVKEMHLDRFAAAYSVAGLGAPVSDHRGFGGSDGTVRQEVDPEQQIRGWRDAIRFAETLNPFEARSSSGRGCTPVRLAPLGPIDYQSPSGLRSLRLEA